MNPITQESLELLKGALAKPNDALAKSISTSSGLLAFDLQAPAKNLYPFVTPIRNVMPRVAGGTGAAVNWRQVNAIIGSGFDAMGWVPEGQRSGQMSYSTSNKSATYVTIGEEDAATFEAISAGREFEDIQARMTFRLLQKMMLKEEMAILAGNASLTLGTPATPMLSASGSIATLPTGTYFVKVACLTLEGFQNSSVANGVATSMTVTGADGKKLYAIRRFVEYQRRRESSGNARPDTILQRHPDAGRGGLCLVRLQRERNRDLTGHYDDQQPCHLGPAQQRAAATYSDHRRQLGQLRLRL